MKRVIRKVQKTPTKIIIDNANTMQKKKVVSSIKKNKTISQVTISRKTYVQPSEYIMKHRAKGAPKITYSKIVPIWKSETVFIIGGGPSLKDFNFNSLLGKNIIVINKAFYNCPFAQILYWTDSRFYTWYKKDIDEFEGEKITIRSHTTYTDDIKILRKGKTYGLETAKDMLAHGNNSGYAAINLAVHLGVKRIILLGYDMGNNGRSSHYHDGYPVKATGDNIYKDQFIPGFNNLENELKLLKIEVLNASMYSKLTAFPKITLEKALSYK